MWKRIVMALLLLSVLAWATGCEQNEYRTHQEYQSEQQVGEPHEKVE